MTEKSALDMRIILRRRNDTALLDLRVAPLRSAQQPLHLWRNRPHLILPIHGDQFHRARYQRLRESALTISYPKTICRLRSDSIRVRTVTRSP